MPSHQTAVNTFWYCAQICWWALTVKVWSQFPRVESISLLNQEIFNTLWPWHS